MFARTSSWLSHH
jgi:hypothetical protein